jgi:putative transposase
MGISERRACRAVAVDAASRTEDPRRRGEARQPDRQAGYSVWTLWLSADHGVIAERWLGEVLDQLYELFISRGLPEYIRSDNGAEFAANAVRKWLGCLDVTTQFIEPGSPWENGYIESFNGKMRDELLNGELLDTLEEAMVLVEAWRKTYNRIRPHSSLGYRLPAPEAHVVGKFTLGLA